MQIQFWVVLALLSAGMFLSVKTGKLSPAGALTGGLLGMGIFLGAGFTGLAMLGTFFMLGSAATSWKLQYKASVGLAEANKGRRTAGQAWANGGVAGIAGLLAWLFPAHEPVLQLMLAASFAAATADTLSSELGNVLGRKFYNILTLRADKRGLNGVISREGTLCGLLGSGLIALIYAVGFGWSIWVAWVVIAGTAGNLFDSVLGATLERKQYVSNNAVNFLNTLAGALTALLLYGLV